MAVHKALPKRFADIHPKYLSPGFSTLLFGAISIVWYVALTLISPGDVLANSIEALGFGIAFYYGLTGFACVIYYRRHIFKSLKNFIFIGLAPLLGAHHPHRPLRGGDLLLLRPRQLCFGKPGLVPGHSFQLPHSSIRHFYVKKGLGPPLVLGIGLLVLGVPLMLIWKVRNKDFFTS